MSKITSLSDESAPVTGVELWLARVSAHHTMVVAVAGSLSGCTVALQGSHDGLTWTDIGTVNSPAGGIVTTQSDAHLMARVRAELRAISGTGTVTATIASEDGT